MPIGVLFINNHKYNAPHEFNDPLCYAIVLFRFIVTQIIEVTITLEISRINKLFKKLDSPKMVESNLSKLGMANHLKTPDTTNIQVKKPNKSTIKRFFSIL